MQVCVGVFARCDLGTGRKGRRTAGLRVVDQTTETRCNADDAFSAFAPRGQRDHIGHGVETMEVRWRREVAARDRTRHPPCALGLTLRAAPGIRLPARINVAKSLDRLCHHQPLRGPAWVAHHKPIVPVPMGTGFDPKSWALGTLLIGGR